MRTSCLFACVAILFALAGCDSADPSLAAAKPDPFPGKGQETKCLNRNNDTVRKLTECVTLDGVRLHQRAFQDIADAHGGTRADNTPGYTASVDYIVSTLQAAGWDVQRTPFSYPSTRTEVDQLSPVTATYEAGNFTGSGEGEVLGSVVPVDLALADPQISTSGCEVTDFSGIDFSGPADIALIQRGACFFSVKARNAQDAGAEAVIILNQGNSPTRTGVISGNATSFPDGTPSNLTIPVVGVSFADGVALSTLGSTARVLAELITVISENVIAETRSGDPNNVVMVGAHLDSVPEGPGVQDNGSGSAAILETALRMAKVEPLNKVRFAWWGAEELGLIGSNHYVDNLSEAEKDAIALYLNFDMIGSPNYVRFVLDGDGSALGLAGPPGSEVIEAFFSSFYGDRGLASEESGISFRSDYAAFFNAGIPFGGVFTGAEGIKTDLQAAVYGGSAGEQYDPCYHLACDTFDNVSLEVLDLNADAVAAATIHFAMSPNAGLSPAASSRMRPSTVRSGTARPHHDHAGTLATE